ncbi:GNAT family N-acetyltransferase [Vibrio sinaloensis]|uniref:GNAT family N-acetyltransferase n=1 Tax=Photobacterium sp. (strain ATCC 43367) TaxID=379097 RepID=UPI0035EBA8FF
MIEIKPVQVMDYEKVKNLQVSDAQLQYVGTAEELLPLLNQSVTAHGIYSGAEMVGVFLLDTGYDEDYLFADAGAIGVRGFLVDQSQQGRGIGTRTVLELSDYIKLNFPKAGSVFLTVNCKNPAAKKCYENGGFLDTQELYHGGSAGPQHIMKLAL